MYQEFKRPVNMNKILISRQRNAAKYASADITRTKYERYSLFADLHDVFLKYNLSHDQQFL